MAESLAAAADGCAERLPMLCRAAPRYRVFINLDDPPGLKMPPRAIPNAQSRYLPTSCRLVHGRPLQRAPRPVCDVAAVVCLSVLSLVVGHGLHPQTPAPWHTTTFRTL